MNGQSLKIIHIASGDLWGGAEAQLFTLAKTQHASDNTEVNVVLMNPGVLANRLKQADIPVHILDESQLRTIKLVRSLATLFKQLHPHIIHTHRQKENILASIANVISIRTKSLRTQHGANEFRYSPLKIHKHIQRFADWFCGRYLQQGVIAVSSELADKLAKHYPKKHLHVIENGVDLEAIQAAAATLAPFKTEHPNHFHIGIVGRLVPVKRVDIFLEIAKLLISNNTLAKPLKFHIIGDGPLKETLITQSQAMAITEDVIFHGHQSNIASYIKSLDILVMCSDHEGLPMTALEAMTLETPIVSHNIGALKSTLKNNQGGMLSDQHTNQSYQDCIIKLLSNPLTYNRCLLNKAAITEIGYDNKTNAKRIFDLYRT